MTIPEISSPRYRDLLLEYARSFFPSSAFSVVPDCIVDVNQFESGTQGSCRTVARYRGPMLRLNHAFPAYTGGCTSRTVKWHEGRYIVLNTSLIEVSEKTGTFHEQDYVSVASDFNILSAKDRIAVQIEEAKARLAQLQADYETA